MDTELSVVVPVKNRASLVGRTLDSIKAQTWRPLRVIVVDNASTDDTPRVLEEWKRANESDDFTVDIYREETPGPSAARRRGIEETDSRYVMHFDSDDIMLPGHIAAAMERLQGPDNPDIVCFRVRNHHPDGTEHTIRAPRGSLMEHHLVHSMLCSAGYVCETALVRRAGNWNVDLHCWEDYELGVRLLLEARRRAFIPDVNVEVYGREDSVTGKDFSSRAGEWEKALDVVERDFENSLHKERKRWIRFVAYRRAILAACYKREGNAEKADETLKKALSTPGIAGWQKLFLKSAYAYTAKGGRGASFLANLFL